MKGNGGYPGRLLALGDPGPSPAGKYNVGVAVVQGQVVLSIGTPTDMIVFDPQNAYELGELLARHAHEARFPGEKIGDRAYLAQQIKARVTDEIREFLVGRAASMLRSQREKRKVSNKLLAVQLVDQLLAAVT